MKWLPIEHAPKDNKRPLYIAQFNENGKLVELDWDASWEVERESWELPQEYYVWMSANGRVEEPTHFAYMDNLTPPEGYVLVPVEPTKAMVDAGAHALPRPTVRVSAYGEGTWTESRPWSENNAKARAVMDAMVSARPEVP